MRDIFNTWRNSSAPWICKCLVWNLNISIISYIFCTFWRKYLLSQIWRESSIDICLAFGERDYSFDREKLPTIDIMFVCISHSAPLSQFSQTFSAVCQSLADPYSPKIATSWRHTLTIKLEAKITKPTLYHRRCFVLLNNAFGGIS